MRNITAPSAVAIVLLLQHGATVYFLFGSACSYELLLPVQQEKFFTQQVGDNAWALF